MKDLITFETGKLAKEAGFDIPCKLHKAIDNEIEYFSSNMPRDWNDSNSWISIPTQAKLEEWLRDNHYIYISVTPEIIGSDEWDYKFEIMWLPKDKQDIKRRSSGFKHYCSYREGPGSYSGAWHTYEEALEAGLKYALKQLVIPHRKKGELDES